MPVSADDLDAVDACFRAANYLTVGQIYLQENPLLREPLRPEHVKARLLGHWGTSPGLNLIYAHVNRLLRREAVDALFLAGPGHGGPAVLANLWLEGTYGEVYPGVGHGLAGMRAFFRQFSTPGGVPSHCGPTTPGSIHEGGELGYVLAHAFGAVFDNPDLLAIAVVGDGEAETAPLEGSWKSLAFLNPARDGAVLPILHLNGYKIAGPTVLGRASDEAIASLFAGHGYETIFVEGDEPSLVHASFAGALDRAWATIRRIQRAARSGAANREPWPMIALRTPKGWTGPRTVDGVRIEGTFRAHQVPLAGVRTDPAHLAELERWLRSYRPHELFDDDGHPRARVLDALPPAERRMGTSRHANGARAELIVPAQAALPVPSPGVVRFESTRALGALLRDVYAANAEEPCFRLFCPDETNSNRLGAVFDVEDRAFDEPTAPGDDHVSPRGRVMEVLSEHLCEGWLEGYLLSGRHGMLATYEAFAMVMASMTTQHAKWLEASRDITWRKPVASLNLLLTSTCWRNDHNGFSHQGPGFLDTLVTKQGAVVRAYFPPDANCLVAVAEHALRSRDHVNLIVIDKQPQLQWLDGEAARAHCAAGAGTWAWASNDGGDPDVVLACAGDVATLETIAAAAWLREHAPGLRVRVVNVVDLMSLARRSEHPHGLLEERFEELFPPDVDVVFAFHGYAGVVHQILHGRPGADRFHVRGFREEGSTTTPFDMVVVNRTSRFHLAEEALRRSRRLIENRHELFARASEALATHRAYVREHFEDQPEIRSFTWPA